MTNQVPRQHRITRDIEALLEFGTLEQNGYVFAVDTDVHCISVHNAKTGQLVAFSSTKADFKQSLEEFIGDYGD